LLRAIEELGIKVRPLTTTFPEIAKIAAWKPGRYIVGHCSATSVPVPRFIWSVDLIVAIDPKTGRRHRYPESRCVKDGYENADEPMCVTLPNRTNLDLHSLVAWMRDDNGIIAY
jgi:hypothetical protein